MLKEALHIKLLWAVFIFTLPCYTSGQNTSDPNAIDGVELDRTGEEYSSVRFEPVRMDQQPGVAVIFTGTYDLHYYARPETAPAPEYNLRISANSNDLEFGNAVFPQWEISENC